MSDILSRLVPEKKVNFRGEIMGTTLYQHSIEHRVICDRVLNAFQCIKFGENLQMVLKIMSGNEISA